MDTRTTMIIAKGKPITSSITSCNYDKISNRWDVTFKSGKHFQYNVSNIVFLRNPVYLNPMNYRVFYDGKPLDNIVAIYAFKGKELEYWHICYSNGYEHDYCYDELDVSRSVLDSTGPRAIFEYLREVAGYISVRTEDDTAIL